MGDYILKLKVGRPKDLILKKSVYLAISKLKYGYTENIRIVASNFFGKDISWHTVKKYLDEFVDKGFISREVVMRSGKKTIALYRFVV